MTGPDLNPERRLLGAAMMFRSVLDEVNLDPGDFADPRYAALWELMVSLREQGRSVDPATVTGALPTIPQEHRTGIDGPHIIDLYGAAPFTASEGEMAAREVTNAAALRRLVMLGQRAVQLGQSGGDATEYQDILREEVETISRATSTEARLVTDDIDDFLDNLDNPSPAVPTPWADLNHFIRGWAPGGLHVVGGRPSVGKSIVLLQAAVKLAEHGYVSFHSLEMSKADTYARITAQMASVSLSRLLGKTDNPDRHLTQRDWGLIATARRRIADLKLVVDDRSMVTVADIRAQARSVARRGPLAGVVVDYLQLIEPPRHLATRNRAEVVGYFSRTLKILARQLGVPVIAAVQLNRGSVHRADPRPTMADIRESGQVEQDSDVILLLHAEDNLATDLDLIVAKQRQGQLGVAEMRREGSYTRIVDRPWTPRRAMETA